MSQWTGVNGKYVVITGATSGIGLAAARELAARGARLGFVARNRAKAEDVASQLKTATGGRAVIDVFVADMASQRSVRAVAGDIVARWPRVDVLVNNAGAMYDTRQMTVDGIEMTWAVNHLAPFLLTKLLLDRLTDSAPARVITTTSEHGHKVGRLNFDDLSAERLYGRGKKLTGGPMKRYGETKLANILFTGELARRVRGTGVTAVCFEPGVVATNFNSNNGLLVRSTMAMMRPFFRTPEKGAETLVWLADVADDAIESGGYYGDMTPKATTEAARDTQAAQRLWNISEQQIQASGGARPDPL